MIQQPSGIGGGLNSSKLKNPSGIGMGNSGLKQPSQAHGQKASGTLESVPEAPQQDARPKQQSSNTVSDFKARLLEQAEKKKEGGGGTAAALRKKAMGG